MAEHKQFIDCASLNISFEASGLATVTFAIISNTPDVVVPTDIFGVKGYPIYVRQEPLIEILNFYTTQVTLKGFRPSGGD